VSAAPHRAASRTGRLGDPAPPRLGLPRTAASAVRAIRKARAKLAYPSAKKILSKTKKASGSRANLQVSGVQQVLIDPYSLRDNSRSKMFKKIYN